MPASVIFAARPQRHFGLPRERRIETHTELADESVRWIASELGEKFTRRIGDENMLYRLLSWMPTLLSVIVSVPASFAGLEFQCAIPLPSFNAGLASDSELEFVDGVRGAGNQPAQKNLTGV